LQATSESGEKISRSTTIETVLSPAPPNISQTNPLGLKRLPVIPENNSARKSSNSPNLNRQLSPSKLSPLINNPENNSLPPAELPPESQ
jgi:hypothetical protein